MDPIRKSHATRYWVFRGTTRLGQAVSWGTTAAGCLPVMVEPPAPFAVGPALAVGEPPPSVATSISLADPEGEIAAAVLPDRRGRQGLTGKLYVGEIAGGARTESAASPTLHAIGNASHQDGITTIQLQSDDSHVLGRSIALWTVREILEGTLDLSRDVAFLDLRSLWGLLEHTTGMEDLLGEIRSLLSENLSSVVPWVYGPTITEPMPLNSIYPKIWIDGVRNAENRPPAGGLIDGRFFIIADRDGELSPYPSKLGPDEAARTPLCVDLPMRIPDRAHGSRDVWVRFLYQPEPEDEEPSRLIVVQWDTNRPSGTAPIAFNSPPATIAQVIRDHSSGGSSGLHLTSWLDVIGKVDPTFGDTCGGVFGSESATIEELIQHIAPLCGLRVWLGNDDKLRAGLAGYTYEDQQNAKGNLLELKEGDIFPRDTSNSPSLSSEIIGDPDDDGAGVARVSVEWSDLQREIYPIEVASTIPSLGGGADDRERERILSGAWLFPPRGRDVALALMSGISGDGARAELATHLTVRSVAVHQLMRVSHPWGLDLPGRGWERRLTRVEGVEVMASQDAVRLKLADLGLSERMRLGLMDTVQQWILYAATAAQTLTVDQHDLNHFVLKNLAGFYSAPWADGKLTIWTPAAVQPAYQRSWRAVGVSGNDVIVERGDVTYLGPSAVPGFVVDSILGVGWAVMRTDLLDPDYRIDFIRACDSSTKKFESGRAGFQWSGF